MRPRLEKFKFHNFVARFQDEQYRTCLETFPAESVMSVIDFAEKYTFMDFNEIQKSALAFFPSNRSGSYLLPLE